MIDSIPKDQTNAGGQAGGDPNVNEWKYCHADTGLCDHGHFPLALVFFLPDEKQLVSIGKGCHGGARGISPPRY